MLTTRQQVEQHIHWQLHIGNCSFWWDNWLGTGPLAQYTSSSFRLNNTKVSEFWENGAWSWRKLQEQAPASQLDRIMATAIPQQQQKPDQPIWKLHNLGKFTCKSAWEAIRNKKSRSSFFSLLWHNYIPFKSSFLLWRVLKGKIPTNEKLTNFGIEPSPCFCCFDRAGMDSIDHIFSTGKFAGTVWKSFAASAGLQHEQTTLQARLEKWWTANPRNVGHQLLLQATPIFICWNL